MSKFKKILLSIIVISIVSIFGGYLYLKENKYDYHKYGIYDECTDYNDEIETINKEAKVGLNTQIILTDKYKFCNHEIDTNVLVDSKNINMTYEEIKNMYNDYEIAEFNSKYIRLQKEIETYCPYHYILKATDGKIGIYNQIDENKLELFNLLDINIDSLRENDKKLFLGEGIKIYGQEELYEFIEDFNS